MVSSSVLWNKDVCLHIYSGSLEFKFMVILMIQKLIVPSLELDKLGNSIFNFSGPNSYVLGM